MQTISLVLAILLQLCEIFFIAFVAVYLILYLRKKDFRYPFPSVSFSHKVLKNIKVSVENEQEKYTEEIVREFHWSFNNENITAESIKYEYDEPSGDELALTLHKMSPEKLAKQLERIGTVAPVYEDIFLTLQKQFEAKKALLKSPVLFQNVGHLVEHLENEKFPEIIHKLFVGIYEAMFKCMFEKGLLSKDFEYPNIIIARASSYTLPVWLPEDFKTHYALVKYAK